MNAVLPVFVDMWSVFFFQAEDGIRDLTVTGVQTCALPISVWHNHPWTGPDSTFGVKTPEDLCSLSQPDLRTVVADSIPFAVVSVGRTAQPILCWWRRVQAVVNRHVKFLPRFPRQWLELPRTAGWGG